MRPSLVDGFLVEWVHLEGNAFIQAWTEDYRSRWLLRLNICGVRDPIALKFVQSDIASEDKGREEALAEAIRRFVAEGIRIHVSSEVYY